MTKLSYSVLAFLSLMYGSLYPMEEESIKPYGQETSLQGFARKLSVATCSVAGGYLAYKGIQEGNVQKTLSGLGLTSAGALSLKTTDFSFSKEQEEFGKKLTLLDTYQERRLKNAEEKRQMRHEYDLFIGLMHCDFSSFIANILVDNKENFFLEYRNSINNKMQHIKDNYSTYMLAHSSMGWRLGMYLLYRIIGIEPWYKKTFFGKRIGRFDSFEQMLSSQPKIEYDDDATLFVKSLSDWVVAYGLCDDDLFQLHKLFFEKKLEFHLVHIVRKLDKSIERFAKIKKNVQLTSDQANLLNKLIQKGFDIRGLQEQS